MLENSIALIGGMLIDGTGKDPLENTTILIKGNKIQEVGKRNSVKVPKGYEHIDVTGRTIMPGMFDLHVHLSMGQLNVPPSTSSRNVIPQFSQPLAWFGLTSFAHARLALEMGFTTLRDVGDEGYATIALRDFINSGHIEGPRIICCGQYITITGGHSDYTPLWISRNDHLSSYTADGVDECLKAVRERIKMRVDWIKIFGSGGIMDPWSHQDFNDEELKSIIGEAHAKMKMVSAHLMYPEGTIAAVKAGLDTVEHGTILTDEAIDLMRKKRAVLVPTLYAPWSLVNQDNKSGLSDTYLNTAKEQIYKPHMKSFKMAYEAGIKMAMGTDCGYGPCIHGKNAIELELMTTFSKMTAMEAIMITTKNAAETLKMGDKLGTIEKGKLADIVVVDGNPLENIKVLQIKEKILLVLKEGRVCIKQF